MTMPRWLDPAAAAAYLSIRVDTLPSLVHAGKIPAPSYALGPRRPRYDRFALDKTVGGGLASTDPDQAVEGLLSEIREKSRPRRQKAAR